MPVGLSWDLLARDNASAAYLRVAGAADKAAAATDRFAARARAAADKSIIAGRKLTHSMTLPILGAMAASVKVATDYNSAITRIGTQAGATGRQVAYLNRHVLALAKYAEQGPTDLANAAYHLKSVGLDAVRTMKALKIASDLASVGGADLEETTNALAGAWRTGIRGAKNFHDAAATVNAIIGAGNMTLEQFNAALGTGILASAKTFGLTLKDVGAAEALFTDEGVDSAAAATRLRMSFSLLGAPSQAAEKWLKKIHLTGLRLAEDMRKPQGLITAVADLKKHLDDSGLSAAKQSILLSHAFGGGRSSAAILSMVNNLDVLRQKQDQVNRSMGRFDKAVATQRQTPEAQFKLLVSSLERAGVILGNAILPDVIDLAHDAGKAAEAFNSLPPWGRKVAVDSLLALAALGPVLTIAGRLTKVFVGVGSAAKRAALFMAAPYLKTAEAAQTASLRTAYANAQQKADEALTAASVARSEALKAQAAQDAAIRIAAAAEESDAALRGMATQAGLDAIDFNAAMQAEAAAAERMAVQTAAAAQAAQARMEEAAAATTVAGYKMQAALGGAGIGLAVGMLDQNASKTTKILGTLGSTAAGAALGFSMGGPLGGAIGGLAGGLSSLVGWFHHTESAASQAAQAAQAYLQQQNQSAQDLLATLQAVNGAYGKTAKASVLGQLQRSGVLLKAADLGINPRQLLTGVMGNAQELARIESTIITKMGGAGQAAPIINQLDAIASGGRKAERTFELMQRALGKPLIPAKQLAGGLKNLNKELTDSTDLAVNVSKNNKQVFREFDHAVNGVRQYGEFTALGQRNLKVIQANIDNFRRLAAAEITSGDSLRKVRGDYASHLADLKRELVQMGFNKQQVDTLIGVYKKLPKNIVSKINAEDRATAKLKALQNYINSHTWTVDVRINPSGQAMAYVPGEGYINVGGKPGKRKFGGPSGATGFTNVPQGFSTINESGWELLHRAGNNVAVIPHRTSMAMTGLPDRLPGFAAGTKPDTAAIGTAIGRIGSGYTKPIDVSSVGIGRVMAQIKHAWDVLHAQIAAGLSKTAAAKFAAEIRSLTKEAQTQLAHLRVKISHGDLDHLRKALSGTVADTRSAFQQMISDVRAAGGQAIVGLLQSAEQRLIAFQARLNNARAYQSTVRGTLAGTFDPTRYGSVEDLLGGLGGATSQNKAYAHEVSKLRRESAGNPALRRFVNQLAAQGQSATLQTLAGASKTQLAQVTKSVGAYQGSLAEGSQAAELAKYNQSVRAMTRHQQELTSAIAALVHAFAAHPNRIELNGKDITKHVIHDPQFERLLHRIADLAEQGRSK
ncbi:MAG TPA: phage tail tape measure protein [Kribbella sp.]|nr:phage tail tape measure protein [Kribbella sp.]